MKKVNILKLDEAIRKEAADKATKELQKRIELHENELEAGRAGIKKQIRDIALGIGAPSALTNTYQLNDVSLLKVVTHRSAAKELKKILEELSEEATE